MTGGGGPFAGHTVERLMQAAQAAYDARYTVAGRALHKHGSRPGSAFPPPAGPPTAINARAEAIVRQILTDSMSSVHIYTHPRHGRVIDIVGSDGRGVRFSTSGGFITFLEP